MSKKAIIIVALSIFLIGVIVIVSMNFKSISTTVSDKFWGVLAEQFEKEEKAREDSKYGGVGRDTVYRLGDGKFQIGKFADDKVFFIYNEDLTIESLLRKVLKYKVNKDNLYVISDEGYGIADAKTNKCRLLITVPPEKFTNGYTTDSEGVQHPISRYLNDEHVKYLKSYDEFSDEEQAVFEKMKK